MCNEYHASPVLSICIAFDKLVEIPYASREAMHCAVSARSQRWELRMSMHTPILSRLPLNRLVPFWLVWFQVKSIASSLAGSIPVWPVGFN